MNKKWVLVILDGFGLSEEKLFNGIARAKTPVLNHLLEAYPHTFLHASEKYVGLPKGQMGNSEVGHLTMGAGRIVRQGLSLITHEMASGNFQKHPLWQKLASTHNKRIHLMGLFSEGGVHSSLSHFHTVISHLLDLGMEVFLHLFTDGRDTPPDSALAFLKTLPENERLHHATLQGRFYGMDRDDRHERTQSAYNCIVKGVGEKAHSFEEAVSTSYASNISDEFILPHVIEGYRGMEEGDAILHMNFRADRVRQLLRALVLPPEKFNAFDRTHFKKPGCVLGLSDYGNALEPFVQAFYPKTPITDGLVQTLSAQHKKIFKIAETEKYAHVTFFFNGGIEECVDGEERVLIASPKVATYDLAPEMSAREITQKLTETIASEKFDLCIVNYANPDMVGHTGVQSAIVQAIQCIDACLGKLLEACEKHGYGMLITSDHGNAEQMVETEDTARAHTAHTCNPVPLMMVNAFLSQDEGASFILSPGTLADIAPTLLNFYRITPPSSMTGTCLLAKNTFS